MKHEFRDQHREQIAQYESHVIVSAVRYFTIVPYHFFGVALVDTRNQF